VSSYRDELSQGEDVIDPATWAGSIPYAGGFAPRVRVGRTKWFNLLVEFDPAERHAVHAVSDTRLLLLLTPWPGAGHPGPMSLPDKADAVAHAAEHAAELRDRRR
jgi:hypothetical protein